MKLRSRVSKRLAVIGAVLASGLGALGVEYCASADQPQIPLAFQGTVAGVTDLRPADLLISIEPDPAWLDANVDPGSGVSVYESTVPTSAIATDGADYEVRLDPATVPPQDITQYGLVTLRVSAEDAAGNAYGTEILSIRAVLMPDGSYAWVDPLTPTELVDDGSGGAPAKALRAYRDGTGPGRRFRPTRMWVKKASGPVVVDIKKFTGRGSLAPALKAAQAQGAGTRKGPSSARDEDGNVEPTELIANPVYDASKCEPGPGGNGAGVVRGATRRVMTTIGTSFPIENDRAKMVFDDSNSSSTVFTAKMASGIQDGTGPIQESSKLSAMDKTWGFDWDLAGYNRAYQVQQVYQHVTDWGDRCPGDPNGPYFQSWEPRSYTGGTAEVTNISTPTYVNCVKEKNTGTWKKLDSKSDAYDNNTGVRIADWIGLNLESERSYNLEAQLWYHLTTKTHWLCGNNDTPPDSQKVQDATYDQGAK